MRAGSVIDEGRLLNEKRSQEFACFSRFSTLKFQLGVRFTPAKKSVFNQQLLINVLFSHVSSIYDGLNQGRKQSDPPRGCCCCDPSRHATFDIFFEIKQLRFLLFSVINKERNKLTKLCRLQFLIKLQ